jgi:hypothetical protein
MFHWNGSRRRSWGAEAPRRSGIVLLSALALLALSAALLAGSFAAARAMIRSARSTLAVARADTGARRAVGELLTGWSPALDSLAVDAVAEPPLAAEPVEARPALIRRARVWRVTDRSYVLSVQVRTFDWSMPTAERRMRLLLERPARVDSAAPLAAPVPVTRWSLADLY